MRIGTIKELHNQKGYGFVKEQNTGYLYRFNVTDLHDQISINDSVEFNLIELDPGRVAVNLRKVKSHKQLAC
jgi:CspA family cold shock protein